MGKMKETIAVLGAGTWGAALTHLLSANGHAVHVWDIDDNLLSYLQKKGRHPVLEKFLVNPRTVKIKRDLPEAMEGCGCIFTVIPAQFYPDLWKKIDSFLKPGVVVVNCSKGILVESRQLICQSFQEICAGTVEKGYVAVSGPSFAVEVVEELPTALVAASANLDSAKEIQDLLSNHWLRVYTNQDVLGVEIAGAVKNVIAIASGICQGIGFGNNTKAALLTRGIAEISRLGARMGARPATFYGLAGIGDLILTGMSEQSRNYRLGKLLGDGLRLEKAMKVINQTVEGIETVKASRFLAEKYEVEMPIVEKVYQTLFEGMSPAKAVQDLITRDLKSE